MTSSRKRRSPGTLKDAIPGLITNNLEGFEMPRLDHRSRTHSVEITERELRHLLQLLAQDVGTAEVGGNPSQKTVLRLQDKLVGISILIDLARRERSRLGRVKRATVTCTAITPA